MSDLALLIETITKHHKLVKFAIKQQQKIDRSLEAFVVFDVIGMPHGADQAARKKVWLEAKAMIGEAIQRLANEAHAEFAFPIVAIVAKNEMSRKNWDELRLTHEREMEKLAKQLPVATFQAQHRGFGLKGLAMIIGEAGDLGKYSTHSKVWKRMGVGLVDDKRQGAPGANASKEEWIKHAYSPSRRSILWNIGDSLIKGNQDGRYRTVYLKRKEDERAKAEAAGLTVAPAAKIPKKRAAEFMSEGHIHRRAQRYMEKRLLRDLWQAWRREARVCVPETAIKELPFSSCVLV